MSKLFKSRKFLLLLIDAAAAIAALLIAFFVKDPAVTALLVGLFAAIQPVFVGAIVMIGVEDAAALKAGVHVNSYLPSDPRFRG